MFRAIRVWSHRTIMTKNIAAIILAAGKGTRMKSDLPKVLHPIASVPMIGHVLNALAELGVQRRVVVMAPGDDAVPDYVAPVETVVQDVPRGTADAVKAARPLLDGISGTVLVLFGGDPLYTPETMARMVAMREGGDRTAVVVAGFETDSPHGYGRLILDADGGLEAIIEAAELAPEQVDVSFCNGGVMAIDGALLFDLLDAIGDDNAKKEFYLTDIVAVARARGLRCAALKVDQDETVGVDSRSDLAHAEALMQARLRRRIMEEGVTMTAPETVFLANDTRIGQDSIVHPHVVFGPGVSIGSGVEIRSFSHLEDCIVAEGSIIGPYARLRPGAHIGEDAHIGNFVEIKNANIENGAKVNHLSYIGDARVGPGANIGAGTITCNYDGAGKHHTDIGAGAFIGSNTALVAPVSIGDGAVVGAGSTITASVAADDLVVVRGEKRNSTGGGKRLRNRNQAAKRAKQEG